MFGIVDELQSQMLIKPVIDRPYTFWRLFRFEEHGDLVQMLMDGVTVLNFFPS